MSNLMIITVGTSLFHSASWDERNTGFLDRLGSQADNYKDNWANARIKETSGIYTSLMTEKLNARNLF